VNDVCAAVMGGTDSEVGRALTAGLASAGVAAAGLPSASRFARSAEIASALRDVEADFGRLDAVIDASQPPRVGGDFVELSADEWAERVERPLRDALHVLQGLYAVFAPKGGRVVILLPMLAMTGAAHLAPWAAVAEGYRSLAKSAARGWGGLGITLNCVCLPAALFGRPELERPGLPVPALGRTPDLHDDVAPVVAGLVSGTFRAVTGLTLAVDGGVWMTP
jgi:3-oxoacyl-[acyl-carrier protein] reductase